MTLQSIIKKLEKLGQEYEKEHGTKPHVFSWDEDEGILLCKQVVKSGCLRSAKKPYLRKKTGFERELGL